MITVPLVYKKDAQILARRARREPDKPSVWGGRVAVWMRWNSQDRTWDVGLPWNDDDGQPIVSTFRTRRDAVTYAAIALSGRWPEPDAAVLKGVRFI